MCVRLPQQNVQTQPETPALHFPPLDVVNNAFLAYTTEYEVDGRMLMSILDENNLELRMRVCRYMQNHNQTITLQYALLYLAFLRRNLSSHL